MKTEEVKIENIWNEEKKEKIKNFITNKSKEQTKERILKNKLLSIQYKLEDYLNDDNYSGEPILLLDFVKMYLKELHLTKNRLANYFEMEDSNLHKYLTGNRKLNVDLAMKLSVFSHTKPEIWFAIQAKNELLKLKNEKSNLSKYDKFDAIDLVDLN